MLHIEHVDNSFLLLHSILICEYIDLFIHFVVEQHLRIFYLGVIINYATKNISFSKH